jgi:hypothetical protein
MMMSDQADDALRAFVANHIPSVAQLELVLLLQREPQRQWTAEQAARVFGLSPEMTGQLFSDLCRGGLAAASKDGDPQYRYAPRTAELDLLVQRTATFYQERRVTLIQWIYSPPVDRLRSFADAFDLRKKKEGE